MKNANPLYPVTVWWYECTFLEKAGLILPVKKEIFSFFKSRYHLLERFGNL